ncbi:PspC domain-containing protein [Aeromonas veronii]|nr:PspC domain-containing protein [Aeromonas veronii]MCF5893433.1 PspC domain-containing protein [Aeromonas veronii]
MSPWPKDLVHRKLTGVCAGIARRLGVSRVTVLVMPPRYELKRWLD